MSDKKPWADEPVPLCDEKLKSAYDEMETRMLVVDAEVARDLERRLRHSLKLVNSLRIDAMHDGGPGNFHDPELLDERLSDIEEVLTP